MDKDVHRMDRDALITEVKRLRAGIRSTDGNVSPLTKTAMALAALAIGLGNPRLVQFEFVKLQPTSASQLDAVAQPAQGAFLRQRTENRYRMPPLSWGSETSESHGRRWSFDWICSIAG
jgi:hypothetical protein